MDYFRIYNCKCVVFESIFWNWNYDGFTCFEVSYIFSGWFVCLGLCMLVASINQKQIIAFSFFIFIQANLFRVAYRKSDILLLSYSLELNDGKCLNVSTKSKAEIYSFVSRIYLYFPHFSIKLLCKCLNNLSIWISF